MEKTILAVDIGTSSLKAAIVDEKGIVCPSSRIRFPQEKRTAAHWMRALEEAWNQLTGTNGHENPGGNPAAIVISGNGPTLLRVGADSKPGEILLWNETPPNAAALVPQKGEGSVAGEKPGSPSIFLPRIALYDSLYPPNDTDRYLFSGPEYLIFELTGAALTILPDPRYESAYWPADANGKSTQDSRLPPFMPSARVAGTTGSFFASGTPSFLPAGIPVVTGGPDFYAALLGTGTLEIGRACDRAGTSEGLNVCVADRIRHPRVRTLPAAAEGLWNASYLLPETGARFHAYRKQAGLSSLSYGDLMREIEMSPIIPPKGETVHPGREAVEKIGFAVRHGIEILSEATGLRCEYALTGGQARNDIWNRMKADITGTTFYLTGTPDGELTGDAMLGFMALGLYPSAREAAAAMVRVVRRYEADPAKHALYSEKYARLQNTFPA